MPELDSSADLESIMSRFDKRITKLKTENRKRFLIGIYRDIALNNSNRTTHGEYYRAVQRLTSDEHYDFNHHLATQLERYNLTSEAKRLREQSGSPFSIEIIYSTLDDLEKTDSLWRKKYRMHILCDGIQITAGGWHSKSPFSASIVRRMCSYGGQKGFYEIYPIFDGRDLENYGRSDQVIGWLTLENALSLASATISRNEQVFLDALNLVDPVEPAEPINSVDQIAYAEPVDEKIQHAAEIAIFVRALECRYGVMLPKLLETLGMPRILEVYQNGE